MADLAHHLGADAVAGEDEKLLVRGHAGGVFQEGKEDSSFSEEKEAKRLLFVCAQQRPWAQTNESFLVLFFKKERAYFLRR
jgi:hypothetical protein